MNNGSLGSLLILLLPLLLIVVMALSARRRQRVMEDFTASLATGERVVTTSGIHGTIREIDDALVRLEIAPGTLITLDRRAVGMRAADAPGGAGPETTTGRREPTGPSDGGGQ